jgi:soluble lytic murein transglycosylase-like protein
MFKSLCAALIVLFAAITFHTAPAAAKCSDNLRCHSATHNSLKSKTTSSRKGLVAKSLSTKKYAKSSSVKKRYARKGSSTENYARVSKRGKASNPAKNQVVALIKSMAPRYGVPTWFALRIAHVESGYNPRARGSVGEIGVFQLKCATAKGIGYKGSCSGLYNASTNVQYGLKHLSLAIKYSKGNLKMAASKHNGGLGRKKLVKKYVNRVF